MEQAHRRGRPPAGIKMMSRREIAQREGISESAVKRALRRAERKLKAAGAYDGFLQLAKIAQSAEPEDYRPVIQCGSIECRPEKWFFSL